MERVVIAGASVGGLSVARELRRSGFEGVIQLVDPEPEAPYRRPSVSKAVLTGDNTPEDVTTPWPEDLELERVSGRVTELDLPGRTVTAVDGPSSLTLPFDGLVIATGSAAQPWPVDTGLDGVCTLRSLGDGLELRAALLEAERLVIIGAGFIGLEVAASARKLGVAVTVVEAAEIPLSHALGPMLGEHIAQCHRDHGVDIICGAAVASLDGSGRVEAVSLADGRRLEADLVLAAIGAAPAVDWLRSSGLDDSNGVMCDSQCAVLGTEGVVAAGDMANWFNPLYGQNMRIEHWTNAIQQGTYAARRLLGTAAPEGFVSAPYFWSDQYDIKIQSIGVGVGYDEIHVLENSDRELLIAYGRNGQLAGVAGVGGGTAINRYRRQVEQRAPMDEIKPPATVGQA